MEFVLCNDVSYLSIYLFISDTQVMLQNETIQCKYSWPYLQQNEEKSLESIY